MNLSEVPVGFFCIINDVQFIKLNENVLNTKTWQIESHLTNSEVSKFAPVSLKMKPRYKLFIEYDAFAESPLETGDDGRWQIYSFMRSGDSNYKNPGDFIDPDTENVVDEIQHKLKVGLAFMLQFSEHGPNCEWEITHPHWSNQYGIAVWEEPEENIGAKSYEDRKQDCSDELGDFNDWLNGSVYYFKLTEFDEVIEWGNIYGAPTDTIRQLLPKDATPENLKITDPNQILDNLFQKV